jgi:hypothetical protein
MKTFRKLGLGLAVSAISTGLSAEVIKLDDQRLREVTGQAGLTIDVESRWEIGEFAYKDAGFLLLQGLRMGGHDLNDEFSSDYYLDNLRLEIDVAGDGTAPSTDNELDYGFSKMRDYANLYVEAGNQDNDFAAVAGGFDPKRGLAIDGKKTYGDGDLVIHFDITDPWQKEGGLPSYLANDRFATDDYETFELMTEHAVDFSFEIDAIGIARSDYDVGSRGLDLDGNHDTGLHEGANGTTTLISQLKMKGYLGPEDLHISNNGNGFGAVDSNGNGVFDDAELAASTGVGDANSKITWSAYTMITDMEFYLDIAGVQIRDMAIHNKRGDLTGLDGTSSFYFAHSIREIYAVRDVVPKIKSDGSIDFVDGIAINTRFKGDMDIKHLSFGDTNKSIGELYWTDIESETRWVISAH